MDTAVATHPLSRIASLARQLPKLKLGVTKPKPALTTIPTPTSIPMRQCNVFDKEATVPIIICSRCPYPIHNSVCIACGKRM